VRGAEYREQRRRLYVVNDRQSAGSLVLRVGDGAELNDGFHSRAWTGEAGTARLSVVAGSGCSSLVPEIELRQRELDGETSN